MVSNPVLFEMFDLSSVTTIVSGSAPLDKSLADRVHALQPKWRILGAYGMNSQPCIPIQHAFVALPCAGRGTLLTPSQA